MSRVPHNDYMPTSRHALAAVVVVTGLCAAVVAASSLLVVPWAATVFAPVVVVLGVVVLSRPVREMCAVSVDDDGAPIALPGRGVLAGFLALGAAASAVVAHLHQDRPAVAVLAVVLLVPGVWCAAVDQVAHRIPTPLIWTGLAAAVWGVVLAAWIEHDPGRIVWALAWGAVCGSVLFVCAVITAGTPGLADVRLAVVLGTLCGYLGAEHVWALTVYSTMTAGVAAAIQLLHRRFVRNSRERGWLAFGPYLVLGAVAALAMG